MLKIYKNDVEGRLREETEIVQHSWVRLTEPKDEEIQYVASRLGVPFDFIQAPLDTDERSRVQTKEKDLLLIINVPLKTAKGDAVPYRTVPIGIISTADVVVTICRVDHPILHEFSEQHVKHFLTHMKTRFVWQLLYTSACYYLSCLNDIDQKITATEKRLQKSIHNKEVYILLNFNKSLVFFTKSLKANRNMMQKLLRVMDFKLGGEDEKQMLDALIEMQQALDTAEIHNTNLGNLMDAYSAAIENNLNATLKLLTAFTVIAAIPIAIASIYGMNSPLPIQDEEYALTLLMSISVVLSLLTGWVFYKLRLF